MRISMRGRHTASPAARSRYADSSARRVAAGVSTRRTISLSISSTRTRAYGERTGSGGFGDFAPGAQEVLHQLRRHLHPGPVFGRILELLEVVQAARLVDAVHRRDEPHRPLRIGVEMLARGIRRDVDHVAGFPLVAL